MGYLGINNKASTHITLGNLLSRSKPLPNQEETSQFPDGAPAVAFAFQLIYRFI